MHDAVFDQSMNAPLPNARVRGAFGVHMEEIAGSLRVRVSPGMRTYAVVDCDGRRLGDVHGVILEAWQSPHLRVEGTKIRALTPVTDPRDFEIRVLDNIQGSFVAVTHTTLPQRLYPDCGSTVPLVYCPQSRRVASSAGMMFAPEEYRARLNDHRVERLIRREGSGSWLPGTLTAHEGLHRLLANHYLDLETWTARRFWPRLDTFVREMKFEDAVGIVARGLRNYTACAAEAFRIGITVTAGCDSRLLLAAAREVVDRVEFFTIGHNDAGLDQMVARRLAADLSLPFRMVPALSADEADREQWDLAVGHAVLETNRGTYPTMATLDYDVIFTGMFGELGRVQLYRHDWRTIEAARPTVASILARLGRPQDAELVANLEPWLAEVHWLPPSTVLDLAYLELRCSSWAMAQHPAQCSAQLELNPIAQRDVFAAFLSVPPEAKAGDALAHACIGELWPDLLDYPFNKLGGYRDYLWLLQRALQPTKVRRYIRARLA